MRIILSKRWNTLMEEIDSGIHAKTKNNFIERCLEKRKSKCKHNHRVYSYFGCAWHFFCMECGESRFCLVCVCGGSGYCCEKHLKESAKKVEII